MDHPSYPPHDITAAGLDDETWHLALEAAGLAFWDHDFRTGTVRRSTEWARMLGYDPDDIATRLEAWTSLLHPDDLERVLEVAAAHERGDVPTFNVEHRMRAADGTWRRVLNWGRIVDRGPDGVPRRALGFHLDITERARAEDERARLEKLESLGTLAGGIAHDFNNVLTAITGNLSLLADDLRGHRAEDLLRRTEQAVLRAQDLTRQLAAFTVGGLPPAQVCDVAATIADAAGRALRGTTSRMVADVAADLWPVECAEGHLDQVFLNVLQNAHQAMSGGGTVTVVARNVTLAAGDHGSLPPGRYVRVTVRDEGGGVPPEERARLFDPFFTTRAGGAGLGLAMAYSTLRHQGGRIELDDDEGPGATFVIHLAACERRGAARTDAPAPPRFDGAAQGSCRVLVMDDDPMVRDFAVGALERLDCTATVVADGAAAVEAFAAARREGRPFDLVLLDLTIRGGMGGLETLQHLRRLDPDVRAVVASGYSQDPVIAEYAAHGFKAALVKPFALAALASVVTSALARRGATG